MPSAASFNHGEKSLMTRTRCSPPSLNGPICLLVPDVILSESLLSFLGLGVQPPESSWGVLIADGRTKIETDPRMLLVPGIALAVTLLCLNFIADGLRDAFDPNER